MDRMYSLNIYETPTHFYIIGSNPSENRFRTLKIDRIAETEFIASEPDHDYSKADIGELLATVSSSSIVTPTEKWGRRRNCAGGNGLLRTMEKAFGLIGAIRFLEGYYLLLVSRAKQVCQIGYHPIYKVEDVSMIYVPASGSPTQPDELKYAKLFQTVDFTTNFYFSYTYQLSRTLQENCLAERGLDWNDNGYRRTMKAERKFVWNNFLLEPLRRNNISKKWSLELVHGYIVHQLVELPCAKLDLILLARRSSEFAGTRFLKRGTNPQGAVANDVETEQICWDITEPQSFRNGKFTAFVQRRGSVPLFWSQDSTHRGAPMVVGKPPIVIDRVEPHALTTAIHFRDLRRKYAHPLIVLNLVKREEHKHNESLLHDIFLKTVRYLNQFRRPGQCIDYVSFDVSRCNKTGRVLQRLDQLGQRTVLSTGWFQNFPELKSRSPSAFLNQQRQYHGFLPPPAGIDEALGRYRAQWSADGQMLLQHGIVRANCVDCLDRTNVAQFGLGKCALGWQLFSMGLLDSPWALGLHTELCRLLEEMFDEHGDTLAWQYAGSQLVHSIKTYKRTAVLQERSRDVLQTISRYYSNTFSDFEKQDGINLFLGIFRVRPGKPPIWACGSDHYLHFPIGPPKRNEFLRWSVAVSSDNEADEEELEEEDKEFRDWIAVKAREGQDIRLDNNWVEIDSDAASQCSSIEEGKKKEKKSLEADDGLFALAHRTFELTSLEQLCRQQQQMQLRRPIALEALEQGHQASTFMWMFKSEHSPSPPPPPYSPGRKGSNASILSGQSHQVVLSSLAAGTASIVRKGRGENGSGGGGQKAAKKGQRRREQRASLLLANQEEEMEGEEQEDDLEGEEAAEEEKVQDGGMAAEGTNGGGGGLLAAMGFVDEREKQQLPSLMANSHEAATIAAAAVEEEPEDTELLYIEDRNVKGGKSNPLDKYEALLNGQSKLQNVNPIQKQEQLGLGTGLKSPRQSYFDRPNAPPTGPLLPISDQDIALYGRYASAAHGVFERHNQQRERRPTVWKLPNPLKSIRRPPIPNSPQSTTGRSTPISSGGGNSARKQSQPLQQRRSSDQLASSKTTNSPTPHRRGLLLPHRRGPPPTSPFRKDFSRLGPVFEFRPAFFTVDSAFHVELGEVPPESLQIYRDRVDQVWTEKWRRRNGGEMGGKEDREMAKG